jgi:HAE1 family hydrophobic/amphiphilic exporter-1
MKEIAGAIVAITLVMSAVFIPVAFMTGPAGVFYRQFSITLAVAIVISGINALTLTPALCALLLKAPSAKKKRNIVSRFFDGFNRKYEALATKYVSLAGFIAARRIWTVGLLVAFFIGTWGISRVLPSGFIPTEDQGMIYVNVTTPPGATLERTSDVLDRVYAMAKNHPAVENVTTLAGYSLLSESVGASYGMVMINLKAWEERKGSSDEIIEELRAGAKTIVDGTLQFFPPPTVPGFGNASGIEMQLLDRTGKGNFQQTAKVTKDFIANLREDPAIASAFTTFDASFPQYLIHVNQEMAAKKGITIDNALSTLQTLLGSYYTTNFIRFGQMYKVMLQSGPGYRRKPEDVLKLFVKNNQGELVAYNSFLTMERVYGPEQVSRYNMYTAAMISGDASAGFSTGDAIESVQKVAAEKLPRGYSIEWSGMTREEILSGNQALFIFAICLAFVYLLLAAQYESFLLPLAVILSLPTGIFGSFLFLTFFGLENNIYAQVALVMLIGLLGKNAILIIEFAILRRKQGAGMLEAAKQGALSRLRPILMTSFAFIAGLMPLCFAKGAGALGNRSIGIASAGGMLAGTIFGLLLIPALYVLFEKMAEKKKKPVPSAE